MRYWTYKDDERTKDPCRRLGKWKIKLGEVEKAFVSNSEESGQDHWILQLIWPTKYRSFK